MSLQHIGNQFWDIQYHSVEGNPDVIDFGIDKPFKRVKWKGTDITTLMNHRAGRQKENASIGQFFDLDGINEMFIDYPDLEGLRNKVSPEVFNETVKFCDYVLDDDFKRINGKFTADYLEYYSEKFNVPINEVTESLKPFLKEDKLPLGKLDLSREEVKEVLSENVYSVHIYNQDMLTDEMVDKLSGAFQQELYYNIKTGYINNAFEGDKALSLDSVNFAKDNSPELLATYGVADSVANLFIEDRLAQERFNRVSNQIKDSVSVIEISNVFYDARFVNNMSFEQRSDVYLEFEKYIKDMDREVKWKYDLCENIELKNSLSIPHRVLQENVEKLEQAYMNCEDKSMFLYNYNVKEALTEANITKEESIATQQSNANTEAINYALHLADMSVAKDVTTVDKQLKDIERKLKDYERTITVDDIVACKDSNEKYVPMTAFQKQIMNEALTNFKTSGRSIRDDSFAEDMKKTMQSVSMQDKTLHFDPYKKISNHREFVELTVGNFKKISQNQKNIKEKQQVIARGK